MFFFLVSLILCLLLTSAVFAGLLKSLQSNWERKNKRPIGYLTPVILTLLFLLLAVNLAVPRLLDTVSLISGDYDIEEIHVDKGELGWNTLLDKGRRFIYNQWKYPLQENRVYQVTFTPRSFYIIELYETAETSDVNP